MGKMMTIPDLAAKAGIAARTLTSVESGTKGARPDTVRCLAGALGVGPEALLVRDRPTDAKPAPPPPPSVRALPLDIPPPKVPARTRLDGLADLVRARGLAAPPV